MLEIQIQKKLARIQWLLKELNNHREIDSSIEVKRKGDLDDLYEDVDMREENLDSEEA